MTVYSDCLGMSVTLSQFDKGSCFVETEDKEPMNTFDKFPLTVGEQ